MKKLERTLPVYFTTQAAIDRLGQTLTDALEKAGGELVQAPDLVPAGIEDDEVIATFFDGYVPTTVTGSLIFCDDPRAFQDAMPPMTGKNRNYVQLKDLSIVREIAPEKIRTAEIGFRLKSLKSVSK